MKTTIAQLKKIIAEEVKKVLAESEEAVLRVGNGSDSDKLYMIDDEGNRDFIGTVLQNPEYENIQPGQAAPVERSFMSGMGGGRRW